MLMPYTQGIPGLVASVDLSTGNEGFTSNLANDRNAIAADNPSHRLFIFMFVAFFVASKITVHNRHLYI
jgi:hypothetical protein